MSRSKHLNIALIGKLELGSNILTSEIARLASKYGEVITGDYLDKKSLPGRKELFHIMYNTSIYECEHINAPFLADNIAKIAHQTDAIVLVVDLVKGITTDDLTVLRYLHDSNVNQIIIALIYNPEIQAMIDSELSELAILDAQENLSEIGFDKICIVTGEMPVESEKIAEKLLSAIDQNLGSRVYDLSKKPILFIEKNYSVSDKGLKNAAVAYGFLSQGILLSGMDLKVFGGSEQSPNVRIRSLQIFGNEVGRCEPGRSVAVLLERAPKNFIESGQILGALDDDRLHAEKEFNAEIEIPSNLLNNDPLTYFTSRQQFEIWLNMGKYIGRWGYLAMKPDGKAIIAKIRLDKPVVMGLGYGFLSLIGRQLCSGRIID